MSTEVPESTDQSEGETPPESVGPFQAKTFDEAYVKKLRDEAAKHRTEAKANADAAKRLGEIEEASKTAEQKSADQLAAAQRDAETARAEALRFRIASKFQVSDEDADLFLTGIDEETLTRQAQRLTDRDTERKKQGNYSPREGATPPTPAPDDEREFVRNLFGAST